MDWKLDKNRPICPQIEQLICVSIAKGEFLNGERLLSVREVALKAGVNPNTVQKAFDGLERQGLIYSIRGSGWYVGDSKQTALEIVDGLIMQKTEDYFNELKILGLDSEQIKNYVKEYK